MSVLNFILRLFGIRRFSETEGERKARETRCPPGWVWVKTTGSRGKVWEEGWEFKPPPDRYERDGLDHLPAYIEKLFASQNWFSSVGAFTLHENDDAGISIWKTEGEIEIHEHFPGPEVSEVERRARALADELGLKIKEEYRTLDSDLMISWLLPYNPQTVVEVAHRFATEVRQINPTEGLNISFEEHPDNRHKFADQNQAASHFIYPIEDPTAPPPVAQ